MTGSLSEPERRASLLRQAVGHGGPAAPGRADWTEWLWLARTQRVLPLLYHLVDRVPTDLDEEQRTELRGMHGAVMCRCVQLEHHLLAISRVLASMGITSVVLKGGATAHLDHPDPSWREFSDIDLLIDPSDLIRARAILDGTEWVQGYPLPAGHDRFTHAITFVHAGMELDLHQRISHRALGRLVPTGDLLARAMRFEVAGTELMALDPSDRLIHAALHAVASGGRSQRLSTLADILVLAELRPQLAGTILDRADQYRVRSLVERGIRDAYRTAQLEVPAAWLDVIRQPAQHRDRLVDRAYLDSRHRPVLEEIAHLRALDGFADRARYLGGFLLHEEAGFRERVRYLWRKVRGRATNPLPPR